MSLLIKNGNVVTASEQYTADIYCEGEQITRIGKNLEAPPDATVVDATGKYVSPGWIDVMDQSGSVLRKNGLAENKIDRQR